MDQDTARLKEALAAGVREHGLKAVVGMLSHVCRSVGHTARFEKEDHQIADLWYQAGEQLTVLSMGLPGKETPMTRDVSNHHEQ